MAQVREKQREEIIVKKHLFGVPPPDDKVANTRSTSLHLRSIGNYAAFRPQSLFEDPAVCFEWFRERCTLNEAIEENKALLKAKYEEARTLGDRANQSRGTISYLKNSIEAIRRERCVD